MSELIVNAIEESLPSDVSPESLPEQAEELQTQEPDSSQEALEEATSEKAVQEENVPFNKHPDWISFQERKEKETQRALDRADRLEQKLLEITGNLSNPRTPEKDPYEGLTREEQDFWKAVDQRIETRADKKIAEKEKVFMAEQNKTRQALAMMAYKEFQTNHPDVKPDSEAERSIAEKYRQGYSLDDAYRLVTSPSRLEQLETELAQLKKSKQAKRTNDKIAANLETGGVQSGSPIQSKDSFDAASIVDSFLNQGS